MEKETIPRTIFYLYLSSEIARNPMIHFCELKVLPKGQWDGPTPSLSESDEL